MTISFDKGKTFYFKNVCLGNLELWITPIWRLTVYTDHTQNPTIPYDSKTCAISHFWQTDYYIFAGANISIDHHHHHPHEN